MLCQQSVNDPDGLSSATQLSWGNVASTEKLSHQAVIEVYDGIQDMILNADMIRHER